MINIYSTRYPLLLNGQRQCAVRGLVYSHITSIEFSKPMTPWNSSVPWVLYQIHVTMLSSLNLNFSLNSKSRLYIFVFQRRLQDNIHIVSQVKLSFAPAYFPKWAINLGWCPSDLQQIQENCFCVVMHTWDMLSHGLRKATAHKIRKE